MNTPWFDPERKIFESAEFAPFKLKDGEELDFTCYIDGPVVDVFVNGRQAITRRVCVPNPDERLCPALICENAEIVSASSADMMPTNAY